MTNGVCLAPELNLEPFYYSSGALIPGNLAQRFWNLHQKKALGSVYYRESGCVNVSAWIWNQYSPAFQALLLLGQHRPSQAVSWSAWDNTKDWRPKPQEIKPKCNYWSISFISSLRLTYSLSGQAGLLSTLGSCILVPTIFLPMDNWGTLRLIVSRDRSTALYMLPGLGPVVEEKTRQKKGFFWNLNELSKTASANQMKCYVVFLWMSAGLQMVSKISLSWQMQLKIIKPNMLTYLHS